MIAKTPPMGWNSWDCYGASVTEQTIRRNADYMAVNLRQYGWEYIVVDIQWYQPTADSHEYIPFADLCMDEYGRLMPAPNRFPSSADGKGFAPLAEYVHSLGLRFGIHIMRGMPRMAAHRDLPIKGSELTARAIADPSSICAWNPDMYGLFADRPGAREYYDSLFELYASWGVDFVKVDDIAREYPRCMREIEIISDACRSCGRDMVLSLSPGPAPVERAEHLKRYANMWRITDDFWDKWELLLGMFERAEKWCVHSGAGHWPDADMLPVGAILQDYDPDNRTKFTLSEQRTMLTLWCIMRSPLILGCELTKCDHFTLELLTNSAVLNLTKTTHSAHPLYRTENEIVWQSTPDEGGGRYVAVFNIADIERKMVVGLAACGLEQYSKATELWKDEPAELNNGELTVTLPAHDAAVFMLEN